MIAGIIEHRRDEIAALVERAIEMIRAEAYQISQRQIFTRST